MNRIFALHFLTSFSHFIFHFISYIIYENLTAPPTAAAAAAAAAEKLGPHSLCRNVYISHIKKLIFNGLWPLKNVLEFFSLHYCSLHFFHFIFSLQIHFFFFTSNFHFKIFTSFFFTSNFHFIFSLYKKKINSR